MRQRLVSSHQISASARDIRPHRIRLPIFEGLNMDDSLAAKAKTFVELIMQNSLSQIERVLDGDERFYRKREQLWENAPTRHQAEEMRKSTCNRLLRFASTYPQAAKVAARLARCRERDRCLSPACPVCARAYQRVLVEAVGDRIRKERLDLQKIDLVDVLAEERSIRQLDWLRIKKLKRRTTARLDAIGHSGWLIGAVDISRNVNGTGKRIIQNHWCPHVGAILLKPKTADFKKLLRQRYKPMITSEDQQGCSRLMARLTQSVTSSK
jgi:hypothetical protein